MLPATVEALVLLLEALVLLPVPALADYQQNAQQHHTENNTLQHN
jgi:hypothetical protein